MTIALTLSDLRRGGGGGVEASPQAQELQKSPGGIGLNGTHEFSKLVLSEWPCSRIRAAQFYRSGRPKSLKFGEMWLENERFPFK